MIHTAERDLPCVVLSDIQTWPEAREPYNGQVEAYEGFIDVDEDAIIQP